MLGGSAPPRPPSHVPLPAGLIAEQFLESTASQLTYHGLCELTAAVKEEELSVFFRNNHFSTMIKHKVHCDPVLIPALLPCRDSPWAAQPGHSPPGLNTDGG